MSAFAETSEGLRGPLFVSIAGHVFLASGIAVSAFLHPQGSLWGDASSGGAATVRLVGSASIPLPAAAVPTENKVATENPGLHYTEPPKPVEKPAPKAPPPKPAADEKAVAIPARNAKVAKAQEKKTPEPKPEETPNSRREIATTGRNERQVAQLRKPPVEAPPSNEVPYGQGGPVQGPYGGFQSEAGSGGFRLLGESGDFGSRYSWYVNSIRNRISGNWLKSTVDPNIHAAPRVYVTFTITRDGRIVNPQITASSGISSLDRSALRAVYDSSPMPPLPGDYPASSVSVEFWFDFLR